MKAISSFFVSLALLPGILALPGVTCAQSPEGSAKLPPRVLTLSATDLLKLMPDTPPDWKVTSSQAAVQLTSWLLTVGIRNIEYTPPPKPPEPGKTPETPVKWTTTFQLMDTGCESNCGAQFEGFKAGSEGQVQRLFVKNCPTIIAVASETVETVDMYIAQRFMLHIELKNQPKSSGKQWADRVAVEKFSAVPAAGIRSLPESVVLTKADELHPQNNRQTTVHVRTDSAGNP